jgi:hypothetical protein
MCRNRARRWQERTRPEEPSVTDIDSDGGTVSDYIGGQQPPLILSSSPNPFIAASSLFLSSSPINPKPSDSGLLWTRPPVTPYVTTYKGHSFLLSALKQWYPEQPKNIPNLHLTIRIPILTWHCFLQNSTFSAKIKLVKRERIFFFQKSFLSRLLRFQSLCLQHNVVFNPVFRILIQLST